MRPSGDIGTRRRRSPCREGTIRGPGSRRPKPSSGSCARLARHAPATGRPLTRTSTGCRSCVPISSVRADGDAFKDYWLTQIDVHRQMVTAWIANAQGRREEALQMLRTAADREDAIERDPVVPGPIISARELLGELLLESNRPRQALEAFEADLRN